MEDIDLTDLYEEAKARSLFCSSPHHFVLTVNALREIILADREKRAQAAQGEAQKPLTVEQIDVMWGEFMSARGSGYVPDFVRAVELAHGIGVKGADQ